MYATRQIVVLYNSLAQKVVAALGAVATKGCLGGHLVNGLVHGLDDSGTQRLRNVANAQTDDAHLGVRHFKGVYLFGNVGKQIVVRQF